MDDYELSVTFFFSSRTRHTRFDCDWSSDVCSSDLALRRLCVSIPPPGRPHYPARDNGVGPVAEWKRRGAATPCTPGSNPGPGQIGRAACRERVSSSGVGVLLY